MSRGNQGAGQLRVWVTADLRDALKQLAEANQASSATVSMIVKLALQKMRGDPTPGLVGLDDHTGFVDSGALLDSPVRVTVPAELRSWVQAVALHNGVNLSVVVRVALHRLLGVPTMTLRLPRNTR